jgi:glycosyltransferase involved in cell wall biosynthesis
MTLHLLRRSASRAARSLWHRSPALRRLVQDNNRGQRLLAALEREFGIAARDVTRNDRALAELLGLFDTSWYREQYPDVAAGGSDPFAHYMMFGWREGRTPAPGFGAQSYAQVEKRFDPQKDNPILHLLQIGLENPAVCRWLHNTDGPTFFEQAPSVRFREGLCILGNLRSETGLGQAARNLAYACDAERLPVSFRHLPLPGRESDEEFATKCNAVPDRRANLLVTGLPAIGALTHEIGPGQINILYPFWELGRVPKAWLDTARRFDEIWAPSSFVAQAFPSDFDRPVRLVRQPLRMSAFLPDDSHSQETLRFYTYLDFDSFGVRKNPTAAVRAFQAAFPALQRDVRLIVKLRGGQYSGDAGMRKWLFETAALDSRIEIVDKTLDRAEMDALMQSCDVFISLHRSEGFGFGAAEALAAGKAVVATDYAGTTDFIAHETGYPVGYDLVPLKKGDYPGCEGQVWADPSLDATVAALRSIYDDPAAARAKGKRGRMLLRELFSPAIVGACVRELLEGLGCLDDDRFGKIQESMRYQEIGADVRSPWLPTEKAQMREYRYPSRYPPDARHPET